MKVLDMKAGQLFEVTVPECEQLNGPPAPQHKVGIKIDRITPLGRDREFCLSFFKYKDVGEEAWRRDPVNPVAVIFAYNPKTQQQYTFRLHFNHDIPSNWTLIEDVVPPQSNSK